MTNEMIQFFKKRTKEHIIRVQKYCRKIEKKFPEYNMLHVHSLKHDANKFFEPLYTPYVHLTWKKRNPDYEIPEYIDITEATEYHVKTNDHHPEFWTNQINTINPEDRDAPFKLIDGTEMPDFSVAEMCADWMAMAEELNSNPFDWAKQNINVRWKFTEDQEELIYKILKMVWN